jgi:hypothetical protein
LAACTTSGQVTPKSSAPSAKVVVVTNETVGTVVAEVGDIVEVELTSTSHGRSGAIVPWSTPKSSDGNLLDPHGVVIPPGIPACPVNSTCTFFRAARAGSVIIEAIAPSGIICASSGGDCVGITAAMRDFRITIRAPV